MSRREDWGARSIELFFPTYPAWDGEPPETSEYLTYWQYKWVGWWFCVRNYFNRPELPADFYPRPESLRSAWFTFRQRPVLLIVPIEYLDDVVVPGDLTPEELERFNLRMPIAVSLPVAGAPIVPRQHVPTLLQARERGYGEIACRVGYV